MNPGSGDHSHLAPEFNPHRRRRPSSDRRSSASFTDGVIVMQRELSNSSFVTESSRTSNFIHSNVGDSILPTYHTVPSYSQEYSGAFNWSINSQVPGEDDNTFDHNLFPSITAPQLTVSTYDENLNIESGVDDPDAILERFFSRLRQDYDAQTDRLGYVLGLIHTYLGVDSIPSLSPSGEPTSSSPLPPSQTVTNSPASAQKEQYICWLCVTPHRICARGTFKRHVNEMHQEKSRFHCMHCEYAHCRKDKLQGHLRVRHPEYGRPDSQEIKDAERMLPVPLLCGLCTYSPLDHRAPFESWESWFQCIEAHCRIEVDDEEQPESESHLPDQNDGNAGGAAGDYFPSSPFYQGPNAGGGSFGQVNDWNYGTGLSQWPSNTQTRSGCQASCNSSGRQACELGADPSPIPPQESCGSELFRLSNSKYASISLPKQLVKKSKPETPSKMNLAAMNNPTVSILSEQMSMLLLDSKPKAVASLNGAQRPLSTKKDSEMAERIILEKSSLIPNVIQGLALASLVYEISLHTYGKLYNNRRFHDYAKVVADPLDAGEKALHHIHYDHPISREIVSRQLTRCHASLDAIQSELSTSSLSSHATTKQMCRRRRLSSLLTRLRAVTFILSLQKEVVGKETPNVPIVDSQLDLVKPNGIATPPPAYQKYPSEPCETSTKSGSLALRMPTLESSLGASDVSNFLHALTSSISMPKASFVESYEDVSSLLHYLVPNIPGTSF